MALKTASASAASAANRKDISTAANGVTLEHRHFSFIAATLKRCKPTLPWNVDDIGAWETLCGKFADDCAATNPKFDRARFLAACGV